MDVCEFLRPFRERFEGAGLPRRAWTEFEEIALAYRGGASGLVPWNEVEAPAAEDLVALEELPVEPGKDGLQDLAWIVLNGGLGTTMEMAGAKSLVPVKGEFTFLDLIVRHVMALRDHLGVRLPLLFMNSFATQADTVAALTAYPDLAVPGLPLEFCQHQFPRIRESDGAPFGAAEDREAWAPPGHGNLFAALESSGALAALLEKGIRWAFVSNADNLGASPHPGLRAHLERERREFAMEVTPKTAVDVKGGTLVRRRGRLELLELAQVPPGREGDFQDLRRFPAFNTNNLWVDLRALASRLERGGLQLPLIVNRKQVGSTAVIQLETAMGAAIGSFPRAVGVVVPRARFAPVKTTEDLLVRRSDAFVVGEVAPLVPNPRRDPALGPPVVKLDARYYRSVPGLDLRIPAAPSLLRARSLDVLGDVRLGRAVEIVGEVRVEAPGPGPYWVADGSVLSG